MQHNKVWKLSDCNVFSPDTNPAYSSLESSKQTCVFFSPDRIMQWMLLLLHLPCFVKWWCVPLPFCIVKSYSNNCCQRCSSIWQFFIMSHPSFHIKKLKCNTQKGTQRPCEMSHTGFYWSFTLAVFHSVPGNNTFIVLVCAVVPFFFFRTY